MALAGETLDRRPAPRDRTKPHRVIVPFRQIPPLSEEEFRMADGVRQEKALLAAIEKRDTALVATYRPDMNPYQPLKLDERRMAVWTHNITQRPDEIRAPRTDIEDGLFVQIHHTTFRFQGGNDYDEQYRKGQEALARQLELERQRAQMFSPGQFAPSENIGNFSAARRYFGLLTEIVRFRTETLEERAKRERKGEPILIFQAGSRRFSRKPTNRTA
ncbi:MAG: hypothetical protein AAB532_03715 [Patescibacteria group bacterium]